MNEIVFVDDDETIRATFKDSIEIMFEGEYSAVCLDVEPTLSLMIEKMKISQSTVAYFIDEKLSHGGRANYSGIDIISEIRKIDTKVPIYILTSTADTIDKYLGNIEFVIDKNDWEVDGDDKLKQRFLRHIHTYKDIKTKQAHRFDELFEKSLFFHLDEEEEKEFRILNLGRSRELLDEPIISSERLDRLKKDDEKLDEIYNELKKDFGE